MAFPPAFLDELTARNPIEDVVGQYVSLSRKSSNLFGLCPFHSEKTASFSVAPEKGLYYCVGCHKGGGVINFVMEIEGLDYPDAVRFLAKRAGMEVPDDGRDQSRYKRQERLWMLCQEAARFYHGQLKTPQAQAARDYIAKRRLSASTVTKFGLGYAPDAWTALMDAMIQKGYTKDELFDAGLTVRHPEKGTYYDRFRNRLIFPNIDARGNVVGFSGRVLDDSSPKYINASETVIFRKRQFLFALNQAKKSKEDFIILVEGPMDAIALYQYGFDCAVASQGTALTEEHANLLAKYTKNLVLIYDNDGAGQNATRRAIPMLEKTGMSVRILQIPGEKDPDEFLREKGADAFRAILNRTENPAEYHLRNIMGRYDLAADDQKVAFAKEAATYIATLPNAVEQEIYGRRAAEAAGITSEAMKLEIGKAFKNRRAVEQKKEEKKNLNVMEQRQPNVRKFRYDNMKSAMAEEGLLRLLVKEPSLMDRVELIPEQFSAPLLGKAYGALTRQHLEGRPVAVSSFGEEFTPEEAAQLSAVLQSEEQLVSEQALADYVKIIRAEYEKRQQTGMERLRSMAKKRNGYGG